MDNFDNFDIPKKNNIEKPEKNQGAIKPAVKTIYLDTSENMSRMGSFMGIVFLFICIYTVCLGLVLCVSDSFKLELDMLNIIFTLFVSILFFTLIYFLPSKLFTFLGFVIGAGAAAVYVLLNLSYIIEAAYYTFNLGLYRINQEGYIIGSIIDYDLAKTVNETTAGYINSTAILFAVLISAVFSYFVYSKKNVVYSLLLSVAIVFPGFFYGLIPGYFAFSLVAAFWVSQFAINMFESNHMAYIIGKENTLPDKKLAKYKLKLFKKQYKDNVKSIKSEIAGIVKSPNRTENSIKLDKLLRQLNSVSNNNKLFMFFYGLNSTNQKNKKQDNKNKNSKKEQQIKNTKTKEKFIDPVNTEKQRLITELKEKKKTEKLNKQTEKKEFAKKSFSEKLKIKFDHNLKEKKKYSVKSGYAGIFAFVLAFFAVIAVQPFISPKATFDISMPEKIMNFLTSTVEYTLVGSDSSVYGGYNGCMGGGFLYRPGGANFKDKPILKLTSAMDNNYLSVQSGVVYLKGWTGTIYTGNQWLGADKKQIEEYNNLVNISDSNVLKKVNFVSEQTFFKTFTRSMQNIFGASYQRMGAEMKLDKIKIEHLVSGGRRSFLPYFHDSYAAYGESSFKFKPNADLGIDISNSLFRYPVYTAEFYSVDNILNRAPIATEDLKQYLDYYYARVDTSMTIPEILTRIDPAQLKKIMPDIRFMTANGFVSMSERTFNNMNDEGTFHQYTVTEIKFEDIPESGYIYVPNKYEDYIDVLKVAYNFDIYQTQENDISLLEGGIVQTSISYVGNYINSDYIVSEVLYNKFVRNNYLGLPDNFPQEVKNLALEITEGLDSDYEKALAIEKYLARNYTYTLNPLPPLNPRGDYVYNFLLDIKEGYCTAYASAMVTMLRSLDIPARYSEGYLVDMAKKKKDETGKEYIIIYDYNGHAWPEVYLRGIGWVPFEPTVSYNEEEETETPAYIYTPPARVPDWGASQATTEPIEEEEDDLITAQDRNLPPMFYVVSVIILACIIIYVLNLIIISRRFKYFKSANTNMAVMKMFTYILIFLKHCGFVMHNEEGLKSFAKRVSPNFLTINPDGWEEIAEIMQKSRYSTHDITENERTDVFEFIETLRKECLKKLKFNLKFKLQFVYFMM